jgi:hypothetical protein
MDDGYTRLARMKISTALKNEDAEFAAMSAMKPADYFNYDYYFVTPLEEDKNLWFRHVELLEKRKGAAAVCEFIEQSLNTGRSIVRDHLQYELAKYTARAGDKKKAADMCQKLLDKGRWMGWKHKDADFRKMLEDLLVETGEKGEGLVWRMASELKEIPKAYVLYIQPVGEVKPKLLEAVRSGVETFFGAKTVLLPAYELSYDKPYYVKETNRYNARLLIKEIQQQLTLPSDALCVAMVMEETLFSPEAGIECWGYQYDWFSMIESSKTWAYDEKIQETAMRNLLVYGISASWGVGHAEAPCVTSRKSNSLQVQQAKFAYCPDMQELYKKTDFAEKNRALIKYFQDQGTKIVEP